MRLCFFNPFPLHKSEDLETEILRYLKGKFKEGLADEEMELFACYSNLDRFMGSR